MLTFVILLLQASGTPTNQAPTNWASYSWLIAAAVALVYAFSGILEKVSSGRKDLLEVSDKKLTNLQKEKDEAIFRVNELQRQVEKLELDKTVIEKEKMMLMREHHQLLEISVTDLQTLRSNTKLIQEMEDEVNKYREEKGLQLRPKFQAAVRNE